MMTSSKDNNEQLKPLLTKDELATPTAVTASSAVDKATNSYGIGGNWLHASPSEYKRFGKTYTNLLPKLSVKYGQWSCRQVLLRRKTLMMIILLLIFGFYVNTTLQNDDLDDTAAYIPVVHQSHVLGMKARSFDGVMSIVYVNDDSSAHYQYVSNINADINSTKSTINKGYLVWSDSCKIKNIDPYQPAVMHYFKREAYKPCEKRAPLTAVHFNATSKLYEIRVVETALKYYGKPKLSNFKCCYAVIKREDGDAKASTGECQPFSWKTSLPPTVDSVLIRCSVKKKEIYVNAHAMLPERANLRARLDKWHQKDRQAKRHTPSVLMIGIDSVSRLNLIRAMPKTAQYLYDNEWFEMSGYNKIDDNTFPNLMAVLTGMNKTHALSKCKPRLEGGLDNCTFIWQHFRAHGYVTAYGEDAALINTFNYLKKGFTQPPTDYYMRPYLLAAEKHLKTTIRNGLIHCLGYKHAAEHIYDYALELAQRFHNDSYFGLFWTNTFSHNDISDSTTMDERVREYLQKFSKIGTMDRTIIIFFSDHGIRFGPTRKTQSGHMEERLPFMFIWLPPYLKRSHPEFVNALSVNKNRLTNPYDLHMTLKHALALSGRIKDKEILAPAVDCVRCHSLLLPMQYNRSCADAAIEDHWCTCIAYESIYKNSKTVQNLAKRVINYLNDYATNFHNGTYANLCKILSLHSITSAYRAQQAGDMEIYRFMFYTNPNKALYEATVQYNTKTNNMIITGEVSRLTMYAGEADCMEDFGAKKYCACKKNQKDLKEKKP